MKPLSNFAFISAIVLSANLFLNPKVLSIPGSQSKKDNLMHLQFKESDSIFANPGQGWFNSRRLPSTDRYVRRNWIDFEPERGKYNWSPFEDAIAAGRQKGIKISLRIMTCNPHSKEYYSSPKWLFDEGCKSFEYLVGGTGDPSGGIRIVRIESHQGPDSYRDHEGSLSL